MAKESNEVFAGCWMSECERCDWMERMRSACEICGLEELEGWACEE